jgi:hypothetical protein
MSRALSQMAKATGSDHGGGAKSGWDGVKGGTEYGLGIYHGAPHKTGIA